jgi:glutamine amidotransferase
MSVVILRYNAGNVHSVYHALKRLGVTAEVSDDAQTLKRAEKVIFPGVGAAPPAMKYLRQRGLDTVISNLEAPVLGICLGMQLLCAFSEEGATEGLNIFKGSVALLKGAAKLPHIGWNTLEETQGELFNGVDCGAYCYFVHSFAAGISANTVAATTYGDAFSAALAKDNFFGVQFHPEKSAEAGAVILKNFLAM